MLHRVKFVGPVSQTILKERPLVSCVERRTYASLTL
jgi:hypothetical protein